MFANIPVYLYKNNPKKNWNGGNDNRGQHKYINVLQGETNSKILNFHLFLDDSTPLDLTDKTVTFYFTKPDGTKIFLQADIPQESAANGIALVTLTAQCTSVSGLTKNGIIRVTYPDNSVLKFSTPNLYIAPSDYENAMESTSEFHALDMAINKTQEALSDASAAVKTAQSVLQINQNTITEQINAQKGISGGLATLDPQKKLVQMPTAADVGASNPNLLLNGDFSVWQRGTSFTITDTSKYTYTADRWRVKSATTIVKDAAGLKTSAACTLEQRLEDIDFERINTKTVTLSYSINGSITSKTYTAVSPVVSIFLNANDVLNWAKLEFGDTATAFMPRPYAEETMLCERFYEQQNNILIFVATSCDQTFPYRTKKRIPATVQVFSPNGSTDKIGFYTDSWTDYDIPTLPVDSGSGESLRVSIPKSGYFQFNFTADAEIYN
jgi:hypothetical protein